MLLRTRVETDRNIIMIVATSSLHILVGGAELPLSSASRRHRLSQPVIQPLRSGLLVNNAPLPSSTNGCHWN